MPSSHCPNGIGTHETDNFTQETALEARPHSGLPKALSILEKTKWRPTLTAELREDSGFWRDEVLSASREVAGWSKKSPGEGTCPPHLQIGLPAPTHCIHCLDARQMPWTRSLQLLNTLPDFQPFEQRGLDLTDLLRCHLAQILLSPPGRYCRRALSQESPSLQKREWDMHLEARASKGGRVRDGRDDVPIGGTARSTEDKSRSHLLRHSQVHQPHFTFAGHPFPPRPDARR